ncbi:MAG: HdeD family acid-resistance protein [Campylobacteraceae bacterium]
MENRDDLLRKFGQKAEDNSTWIIIFGILLVILGVILLSYLFITSIVAMYFFGSMMILGGILQIFSAIKMYDGTNKIFWIIIGGLYCLVGFLTLINPIVASMFLTTLIAFGFMFVGVFRIVAAIALRPINSWQWSLFSGVLSLLTGILIYATPDSFTWVIGLFISIDIIFQGVIYTSIGFALKSLKHS